jgi:ribosomal protein S18 acetylase RimI-like enzyme
MNPDLHIQRVDYRAPLDGLHLRRLLDLYARDPMGGGDPLAASVLERLCDDLARRPDAASFLAYRVTDPSGPVGLINCFEGYSTFKAKPLLNVHDIVVHPKVRGQGVGQALLAAAQQLAIERGCCKLTLEVLSGNTVAMNAYDRFGFKPYQLDPGAGQAVLLQKWL